MIARPSFPLQDQGAAVTRKRTRGYFCVGRQYCRKNELEDVFGIYLYHSSNNTIRQPAWAKHLRGRTWSRQHFWNSRKYADKTSAIRVIGCIYSKQPDNMIEASRFATALRPAFMNLTTID